MKHHTFMEIQVFIVALAHHIADDHHLVIWSGIGLLNTQYPVETTQTKEMIVDHKTLIGRMKRFVMSLKQYMSLSTRY